MTSKPQSKEASLEAQNAADEKAKKEELVEAKMRMIRKKNEELMRRQKEIEEDRKNADLYSEMAVRKHPENFPSGVSRDGSTPERGRGRGLMLQELRKETLKAKQWEAKRKENVRKEEEEQRKRGGRALSTASRFLVDDDRVDMSKTRGRNENSWGGASFDKVVNRVQREKEGFRSGRHKGNVEMTMSGKERFEYNQWREERARVDRERKERQKKSGNWSRAWDQAKVWDQRRRMWDADDHSFKNTRRRDSDNSEEWNSDNRNRRRDYQGQGSDKRGARHSGGFQQHDDREMEAAEDWGEATECKAPQREEERGGSSTTQQLEDWGETGESRVSQHDKEWGKTSENQGNQQKEEQSKATENSRTVESNAPQHETEWGETGERGVVSEEAELKEPGLSDKQQHHAAVSNPRLDDTTEVTSESTPQDAPKPQREFKQRRKQSDSAESDSIDVDKELESSVNEVQPPLDKEEFPESVTDKQVFATVGENQDSFESDSVRDDGGKNNKQIAKDTSEESSLRESEHTVSDGDDTASVHSKDREQTSEGSRSAVHKSVTQKAANLPKLNTKVDKKVTFDAEEKEQVKESDSQDTIGDIPPTPDFLKYDHSVDWGDIEIDDEDSEVTEPKW